MPTPTTTPSAAPAAATTPAQTPSSATTAPTTTPPGASGAQDNPFDAYDAKLKPIAKPAEAKPLEEKAKSAEVQPDGEDAAKAAGEKKKVEWAPRALREELERVKGEAKSKSEALTALEAKIKDYESKGKDTAALAERATALEKQIADKDAEIRALKQEASPEFKEKWDKPFNQAADYAKRQIEQLTVITDTDTGATRPATWEDFVELYRLPLNKALTKSEEMFGNAASVVKHHLTRLQDLSFQRDQALAEEKSKFAEREQADQAKRATEREAVQSMWGKVNQGIVEKHPEWYGPDAEDKDGNELLAEGYKLVDSAFVNRNAMTLEQKVVLDANVRHRAAAFGRMVHRNAKLAEKVAELQAELDERKASAPGQTRKPGGEPTTPAVKSLEQDLRESLTQ